MSGLQDEAERLGKDWQALQGRAPEVIYTAVPSTGKLLEIRVVISEDLLREDPEITFQLVRTRMERTLQKWRWDNVPFDHQPS